MMSPTYINVLSVYAYSNLHDLSWGTKGSDTVAVDLGSVKGVGKHVQVEIVSAQTDIDTAYQDALDNIRLKRSVAEPKKESVEQNQKDIYANFRTNVSPRFVNQEDRETRDEARQGPRRQGLIGSCYYCGLCQMRYWPVRSCLARIQRRFRARAIAQPSTCWSY